MNYLPAEQRSVVLPFARSRRLSAPRAALVAVLGLATFSGFAPQAAAQPAATTPATKPVIARGGLLAAALRTLPSLTEAQKAQITKFVKTEVEAMAGGDPSILTAARRNLIISSSVLQAGKPTPASPAYQQAYGGALADALTEQLKHADARIRLNAIVTLTNIAPTMNPGSTFKKPVVAALQDKSEPVIMWGIRAAKEIYPGLLDSSKKDAAELAAAVVEAYRKFPNRAAIAEDAFATLTGTSVTSVGARAAAGLTAMINLLQARADAYANAVPGVPPELDPSFPARPELDAPVITYLTINGWRGMTAEQKAAAGRAIFDQAEQLVRLAPLLSRKEAGVAGPRLDDLIKELRNITSALQVMGKNAVAPEVTVAAQNLNKLCTLQPAQPLMTAELANLQTAMEAAKLLAPKAPPPAAPGAGAAPAAPAGGTATPAKPAAPAAPLNK